MNSSSNDEPHLTRSMTSGRSADLTSGGVSPVPATFGRYQVVAALGRGGFGAVYEGFDSQLQRKVAIKVPLLDGESQHEIASYRSEAQSLARMRYPGIVSVFDVGVDNDQFYIVTELLEGTNLHQWLNSNSPSFLETAKIIAQLADSLAHAHARRVVHRDVKPGNILMTPDRGPVLVDFGLAISGKNASEEIGLMRGTIRYMAPEQVEGRAHRIDGRTDVFALGVILYQMLTGELPFRAEAKRELCRQILHDEPQPPRQIDPGIPGPLQKICLRALRKDITKRYSTAGDMSERLRAFLDVNHSAAARQPAFSSAQAANSESEELSVSGSTSTPIAGRRLVTALHVTASVRRASESDSDPDLEDQVEAIQQFQRQCESVVQRLGGSRLPSSGHEMTFCFGYPLSYEDAPRRAVYAALEIQEKRSELSSDFVQRFKVHVDAWTAIHSGIAIVTGDNTQSLAGDVLNLVRRIDRQSSPSDVVVTDSTYRLIKRHFECESLHQNCDLGNEQSFELLRVLREMEDRHDLSSSDTIQFTPLVGRDQEVNMLLDRWEVAGEGFGQLVALIGEAGLGKSRLVQVLKDQIDTSDGSGRAAIIEWNCSPYHTSSAFYPAKEALSRLLEIRRDHDDQERLKRLKSHLCDLGFELSTTLPLFCDLLSFPHDPEFPLPSLSSPRQKELTLESLHQWLRALSQRQPVLFIVEDLHWIDPSTLDFLRKIADEPIDDPYLCLLTFRPDFTTPWTSRAHQTQIALNRLTRAQVSQIVESQVQSTHVSKGVVDRIAERTDGVPLFVEEYAKMLTESPEVMENVVERLSESTMGSHSSGVPIPETLQGLLTARLDRVAGDSTVVRLAAALGRSFNFEMLAAASDLPEQQLNIELEKLVDHQLLFRRGRPPACSYMFKHALIQDAAYESMLRSQRLEMHKKIADALHESFPETITERPELLAYHYAEAGQPSEAAPLWAAAGAMAAQRGAFTEAVEHLTQATSLLESIPASAERDQLEYEINVPLGIATLSLQGYATPELGSIYERRMELCRELNDSMGQLHAHWAMSSWRIVRDEVTRAMDLGEQMMSMAESMHDDGALMEALFIRAIATFYHGDFARSLEACQHGWQLFDEQRCLFHTSRTGQHAGVAHLCYMSLNHWYLGQPASALRRMKQAIELAETLDHPFSVAFALHHAGWLEVALGRGEEAVRCADRQIEVAREQAFFFWETTGMLFRAGGLVQLDRGSEARGMLTEGLARYEATGAELALPQYHGFLARAEIQRGALDPAAKAIDRAMAVVDRTADRFHEPELWRLRGCVSAAAGDHHQAHLYGQRMLEKARSHDSAMWEMAALLSLAEWGGPGKTGEVTDQIRRVRDRFEPCDEPIGLIEQADCFLRAQSSP